jgi:hypothetical protein
MSCFFGQKRALVQYMGHEEGNESAEEADDNQRGFRETAA